MADKIQILIEAILKKTTEQELENELRKIEKNLKPLKVDIDSNAEAQIKLYKSLQKIYKEEEKQRLNQEKLSQRALADNEKLLQYEQKVRMAIEKQKRKEEELNKILQERIVIYKQEAEAKLLNLKSRYGDLLNNTDIKKQIDAFRESLNNLNTNNFNVQKLNADFKTLEASVKNANAAVKATHRDVMTLGDMFKVAWNKMLVWAGAGTLLFGTLRQIKEGISYIAELDNSLNEIRIVTNKTQQEVNNLALSYNKLAKEMNVTTKEVASTAADLFRQGLNDSQVEERMKAIIQYAKISGISLEESNKIITATANATGESVQKIIDIFALLGDETASGAEEIGEALQKVASTAENSGVSLEKAASWIATISSITRESASVIGTSLKSIISRYEQIKAKGFNEEDATQINDVTKALQAVGITAVDAQGQLRPIAEVLDELGAKWDGLTTNEKAYVSTALAGTYQRNRLITLLDNYSYSLKNYEAALNSAGTAEEKFAIYQESTQAKLDKFKATLESLYQNTLNSGFIKFVLDLGTGIVSLIDKIGLLNTAISGLIIYFTFFKTSSLFLPFINTATIAITKLTAGLNLSTAAAIKLNTVLGMLAPVAVFFAIQGLIKLFDALIVTIDEQKEKVAEAKQEYESITSELSKLNEELKTTNDRINELNSKDKLTLIEENELSKLKLTNEELEKRIALLEREQEIKEKQLAEEAQKLYEKQFGKYDFSQQQIDEYINNAKITGNNAILLAEENNVSALIAAYKQFLDLKKEALSSGNLEDVEHFDDLLTGIEEKLINNAKELLNTKDILGSLKNPTEKQKQILDEIEQALNLINEIIIPDKINENIKKNSESLQKYEDNLKQLNDTIDSVQSDLKTLNQVLDDVQNGQSLNAETVLDLIQKHKELIPAIHKTADGWTIEKDAIEILRKAKIEEARVAIENQINSAKATLDSVSDRVKAYGIEIAAIEDLKSAQQEASKLGFKNFFGENAFENIKFDDSTNRITIGDKITEWSKEEYDKIKQSFNEQKLINDTILKIGELKERNKKLLELLSDPNFGVSSSKSTTEIYEAEINQFQQLEDALAKVNDEIKRNEILTDLAKEEDKINLLSKRIDLYKQEQEILHQLAEARRNVIQQNVRKLQGLGFDISYDRNANELVIRNMERLNQLKGKDAEATNKLRKETDDLIKSTISLNEANREASIQWWQISKNISSTRDSIENLRKEQEKQVEELIDSYRNYIVGLIEDEIDRWEEAKKIAQKTAQDKIDAIQAEIDKLEERNKQLEIEEERQKRLADLAKQRELVENIKKEKNVRLYQNGEWTWVADPKKLKEETEKLKEMQEDYHEWEVENFRKAEIEKLQNEIKKIREDLKRDEEYYDKKIESVQNFLKEYKKLWNLQKEQVTTYQDLIQKLSGIEQEVWDTRLTQLTKFVKDWNNLASQLNAPTIQIPNVSSKQPINTKDSSTKNNATATLPNGQTIPVSIENGKTVTNGLPVGTVVHTAGGDYKIIEVKPDGSYIGQKVHGFSDGGWVDYTGLAVVHGTPSKPEAFLKHDDAKLIYNAANFLKNIANNIKMPSINLPEIKIPFFSNNNSVAKPTENHYHFENLNIQANDPNEMFRKLNMIIQQYT